MQKCTKRATNVAKQQTHYSSLQIFPLIMATTQALFCIVNVIAAVAMTFRLCNKQLCQPTFHFVVMNMYINFLPTIQLPQIIMCHLKQFLIFHKNFENLKVINIFVELNKIEQSAQNNFGASKENFSIQFLKQCK